MSTMRPERRAESAPAQAVAPATAPSPPPDLGAEVWRRWWLIAIFAIVGGLVGVGASAVLPPRYSSTVTLVVQLPNSSADTEALVRTVEALTTSSVVLGDIAASSGTGLSPNDVEDRLTVDRPSGSAVIEVTVVDTSRSTARAVATQVVPSLQQRILQSRSGNDTSASRIAIEPFGGGPENEKVSPPLLRNGAIGAAAGFAIGLLVAVAAAGRSNRRTV